MQLAQTMTVKQISDEMDVLEGKWRDLRDDPEFEGHSGSPGEWMIERMDELETELKRRGATVS